MGAAHVFADAFLAPVPAPAHGVRPSREGPTGDHRLSAAVLGREDLVVAVAASVADELRRRHSRRAAVVFEWSEPEREGADDLALPATNAARALAQRLHALGAESSARGRLAWVTLPPDPVAAASDVEQALAADPAPAVLAIGGARPTALEHLLRMTAEVLLVTGSAAVDRDDAMLRLAGDSLPAGTKVAVVAPMRGLGRRRAQAGWGSRRRLAPDPPAR